MKDYKEVNIQQEILIWLEWKQEYIIDTPGFSSIEVPKIENREELISLFPEFTNIDSCKFLNCSHIHEPNCNVKKAVEENRISQDRYNFYKKTLEILSERWNRYD